ncbi:MAG: DUF1269 domain-containing protein [Actinomycetota bacterium]|nr:DUF1269 domain-containing protein [Actinomycetota bacterium]
MGERAVVAPDPHAVVAVYATEDDLTSAIKHLEHANFDMAHISVLGKGMSEERHVVGFETPSTHTARWAKWGGLWGWLFGAFIFVPGVGHIAIGGYLLFMVISTGLGATGGALWGAMTAVGIPNDGIPKYEADLRADHFLVIAHGDPFEVERARDLLEQTTHERLDHHRLTATASSEAEDAP